MKFIVGALLGAIATALWFLWGMFQTGWLFALAFVYSVALIGFIGLIIYEITKTWNK